MRNLDLSIIIVNYNTKKLTIDCIQSVLDTVHDIDYEIVLMDNSSDANEVLEYHHPQVQCHTIPNNGYANANNLGYTHASGENILLLNPDTLVYDETINHCLDLLRSSGCPSECSSECSSGCSSWNSQSKMMGAIGCRILRPDGSLDHACRRGFPTPFNSFCYFGKLHKIFKHNSRYCQYTMSHLDDSISCPVDSLTGAFMLMPRRVIQEVGLFDETFFMYGEDLDLCYRIKDAGYEVYYNAEVTMLHKKYQSGFAKRSPLVIKHFYQSMILFYNKHYRKTYNPLITWAVYAGVNAIMYMKLIVNKLHP